MVIINTGGELGALAIASSVENYHIKPHCEQQAKSTSHYRPVFDDYLQLRKHVLCAVLFRNWSYSAPIETLQFHNSVQIIHDFIVLCSKFSTFKLSSKSIIFSWDTISLLLISLFALSVRVNHRYILL